MDSAAGGLEGRRCAREEAAATATGPTPYVVRVKRVLKINLRQPKVGAGSPGRDIRDGDDRATPGATGDVEGADAFGSAGQLATFVVGVLAGAAVVALGADGVLGADAHRRTRSNGCRSREGWRGGWGAAAGGGNGGGGRVFPTAALRGAHLDCPCQSCAGPTQRPAPPR